MSTLKTHNLQSPDAGSVNIAMTPNSGVIVTGISTFSGDVFIPDKIIHSGDTNTSIRFPSADTIRLETGGATRLTIDSNGNTLVSGGLYAQGDSYISDSIIHDGDTNTKIRFPSADTITFETAGAEKLRIDSSGRVMIGTTTEGQATADDLTIATSGTTGITIRSGTGNDGNIYFSDGTSGSDEFRGYVQYGHSNNSLVFGTNAGERLRIDQHGRMWINSGGLTTPTMDYKTINTVATPTYEAGITFSRSHTTMGSGNTGGKTIMLGSDAALLFNTHNVGERMRIDSSGRVVI